MSSVEDRGESKPCGLIVVNKPAGVTSRDVVDKVSRPLRKVKVGHAGTLDPLATGVLVIAVGAATRLIEYVQRMPKTYRTVIRLGARSDTDDADGTIVADVLAQEPAEDSVRVVIAAQVGTILQKPPGYSALKVHGRRAYALARAGKVVDLAPRPVSIDAIEIRSFRWPRVELEVVCGSGTYIRSLARDVGESLGCGGLVEVLVRTRIGSFRIEDAVDLDLLSAESIPGLLRPTSEAVLALRRIDLTTEQVAEIIRGRSVVAEITGRGEFALFGPDGRLVAVGEIEAEGEPIRPRRVLLAG